MNTLNLVNNEDIFNKETSSKKDRELITKQLSFHESLEEDWLKFINSPVFGDRKEFPVMDPQERNERLKKEKINETKNHFYQHTAEDLKEMESNPELEDLIASWSYFK